ncbi:MAG: hypothetical protein KatS3mg033_1222 [Thermonema sp.]|jgi:hypothetical protein|uniref:DUF3592 domain-containing protein n=1 Tax=Thermonema sp. TaxID=2231181 RepID=UPI0021DDF468|nr:DUF3592 domain-containing protein [Thermonema sp.]GIV39422.1 MAG: hypothetical protein KatS3mg033_1222 [Thermonema sp.]
MRDHRKIAYASYRRVSFAGIVLMLIGLGLAIWGTQALWAAYSLNATGIRTEGTVIEIGKKGIYRFPRVEFYTSSGEKVDFWSKFEVSQDLFSYKIGDKVPVIYNPDNPAEAQIDAFWERNFLHLFLLLLGGIIALIGWLVRRNFLKKARNYES